MPGNSRRRKRGKPESDDDNPAQAGPSTAPDDKKPSTAAQAVAKRRRLDPGTSSALPSSSPAPVVATSAPSSRRNRSRAGTAKQATLPASNTAVEPVVKEESHDELVNDNSPPSLDPSLQRRSPEAKDTSDTSSLSALSDHDVLNVVKKEEPDEVIPASKEAPSLSTSRERVAESTAEPTRHYTRAEKGKGRAKSPQVNQHLREEAARLEAELAKLKGELTTATSVSDPSYHTSLCLKKLG